MGNFGKDVMSLGPAPTLSREIPVAVFNVVFLTVVTLLLSARESPVLAIVVASAGAVATVVRLVVAARRSARDRAGERR